MFQKLLKILHHTEHGVFIKQLFLFFLAYSFFHYTFFNICFEGFLTFFDHINSYLPSHYHTLIKWLKHKPFYDKSILWGALKHPIFAIVALASIFPFVLKYKKLSWSNLDYSFWLKLTAFLPAFLLSWELTTYDYNYYLNTSFYIDRVIMIGLMIGILIHPLFIPGFIVCSLLYRSQFSIPIGGFPFYDKKILFDLLIIVYTYIFILGKKKVSVTHLFLFILCLIGGNYFTTGLAKLMKSPHAFEWVLHNKLSYLFLNAEARGWHTHLKNSQIQTIISFLNHFNPLLQLIAILIELSGLLFLYKRKWTMSLLVAVISLHLVIFFAGSMFFWKWIIVDLFLICFLWKAPRNLLDSIFQPINFKISLVLIGFSSLLLGSYKIGWHDTTYNQFYTYEVECEDGMTYTFPKNNFNPYHQLFQHDKFLYLNDNNTLNVSGFGYVNNYYLAKEIRKSNWNSIQKLKTKSGNIKFNSSLQQKYIQFIKSFFRNYNKNRQHNSNKLLAIFSAPHHIYNTSEGLIYNGNSNIKTIHVFYNEYLIEENHSTLKNKQLILTIDL